MADTSWEHAAEARAALNAIVTDPEHGADALSSPRTMSNLLKDLLPDAPREKNLLVAAAEAGIADTLREHVGQGMDSSTAIRLTASSFAERSPLSADACSWATTEIAKAMGISEGSGAAGAVWAEPAHGGAGARAGDHDSSPAFAPPSGGSAPGSGAPGGGSAPGSGAPGSGSAPGSGAPGGGSAPGGSWSGMAGGSAPGGSWSAMAGKAQLAGAAGAAPFGQPAVPAYPPVPVPGYQPVPGQNRSSNTLAVVAFVLGLLQFIGWIIVLPGLIGAIAAIVLGFMSLRRVKRTGERGRGLAVTGIILGFAGILLGIIVVVIGFATFRNS